MSRLLLIAAVLAALAVAGCGGDGDGGSADGGPKAQQAQSQSAERKAEKPGRGSAEAGARPQGSLASVQETSFGTILADGEGRTLYAFTKEPSSTSRCYGACAQAWPPFLTKGDPQARSGVKAGLLGTTRRNDGTTQVTYGGHPVYYYVGDTEPGEVGCQNVSEFGGLWLIVAPDGNPIRS